MLPPPPATELARAADVRPTFGPEQVLVFALSDVAENTRKAYRQDVDRFAAWIGTTPTAAVALLVTRGRGAANALVTDWLGSMREEGLVPSSRARRVSALAAVVRAARRLDLIEWSLDVRRPKVRNYRNTRGPSREQARAMLSACESSTLEGLRNRALLLVALTLGLRRHEIAGMRESHFTADGRLRVLGKGEKLVEMSVPEETRRAVEAWLSAWRQVETPSDDVVFRSLSPVTHGRPLGPKGVYDVVTAIGVAVGVRVWPHGLRHTAITTGLEETHGNIQAVSSFGRQEDPKVTARYDDNRKDAAGDVAARLGKVFGEQ